MTKIAHDLHNNSQEPCGAQGRRKREMNKIQERCAESVKNPVALKVAHDVCSILWSLVLEILG